MPQIDLLHGLARHLRVELFINPHPIWTPDIHALPGFTRSDLALRAQLRAGVAAPVLMGQELVAAIEFFATDTLAPDPELLELLVQVGTQAGRVFKRQHHARRLLESATRDPLTGLPNRTLFEARLAELFEALRNKRKNVAFADLYRSRRLQTGQ